MQPSKLDAVKELIFGQNLKEYDNEIATLNKQISEQKDMFTQKAEALNKEVSEAIKNIEKSLLAKINEVENLIKTELQEQNSSHLHKDKFAELMQEIANKLK